jgi:hypothetical protein
MTSSRLTAGALVAVAALLAVLLWRQETRIAELEARAAPAVAAPASRPATAARVGAPVALMRVDPAAARSLADTVGRRVLALDDPGIERLAAFLRVHLAHAASDRIRETGSDAVLDPDSAALAKLDLAAELDRTGLTQEQRRKLLAALPGLARALEGTKR